LANGFYAADQQGWHAFATSAVSRTEKTTLLLFGLDSADWSGMASLNIRASSDSRNTENRKTARSIPSDNPSILTIRRQRTGRQHGSRKAGFDPTMKVPTQLRNSRDFFKLTHSLPPIPRMPVRNNASPGRPIKRPVQHRREA